MARINPDFGGTSKANRGRKLPPMDKTIEKERPASHHSKRVGEHVDITTPFIPPTNRLVKGDNRKTTSDIGEIMWGWKGGRVK
jgi:hypothetical protein